MNKDDILKMTPLNPSSDLNLQVTQRAFDQITVLEKTEGMLRVRVDGGGCSGLQYNFSFEKEPGHEDIVFSLGEVKIISDETSLNFLNGSMIDYTEDMMSAAFVIKNPNAVASCGCGNSFSII
ncbi:HesB/IscA family protein [Candidatus Nucleicultrix amoebiphila]|jgi:iron-sulfur cluster insertion protein|nr:iron-sulfur cluster assembly accessory protein [Candidatus Nucleicultrix amoebiphila]